MPYLCRVVHSDSPSVEKTLSLSTTKGKPISVKISYTSYEEKTVEYTADAADITISSTLPLPAAVLVNACIASGLLLKLLFLD